MHDFTFSRLSDVYASSGSFYSNHFSRFVLLVLTFILRVVGLSSSAESQALFIEDLHPAQTGT